MELVLNEIKSNGNVKNKAICYAPTHSVVKGFCENCGFKELGVSSEGEIVVQIES